MLSNELVDRALFEAVKPEGCKWSDHCQCVLDDGGNIWSPTSSAADAVACAEWFWRTYDQRPVCYIDDGDQWRTSIESTEDDSESHNVRAKSFPESLSRAIYSAIMKGQSND